MTGVDAVRVLVLGNSNSQRPHGGVVRAWPDLAVEDVARMTGIDLDVTHRNFYAHVDGVVEYAAAQVERYQPEVVVIAASANAANLPTAAKSLEDRVGTRLAGPVMGAVSRFDWLAINSGKPGAVVYRAAHGLGLRVLGAKYVISMPALLASYDAVLARLARFEEVQFVVCSTNKYGPRLRIRYPHCSAGVEHFNRELQRMTAARHFDWADRDATVCGPGWEQNFEVDGVHMTSRGERCMADAVVPPLEDAVSRVVAARV